MLTYSSAGSIVWIARRPSVPVIGYPLFAWVPDECIIRSGDPEEGFEHLSSEKAVGTFGGVVRHKIDDEVMRDRRNKACERLRICQKRIRVSQWGTHTAWKK